MERIAEAVKTRDVSSAGRWESPQFGAIYEEHSRAIYYLALRILNDPAAAEDAAHDVFLKAYQHLPRFRGESSVRTWLYRIAINHCRNIQNAWHQRNILPADDSQLREGIAVESTPLRVLEAKELGTRIQKTLDCLTDEYRLLLLLAADERMSYEEIAGLTGQTSDSVRGKLHRARRAFQQYFQGTL
jgi:RNA polymerase sigma-70 factor (ECF subfamily)